MSTRESRPDDGAAPEAFTSASNILRQDRQPAVTGAVRVDLRPAADNAHRAARELQMLAAAPPGAEVVIEVAPQQIAPRWAVTYLAAEARHLGTIRVECCDPETVRCWVNVLRGGDDPWTLS